jgi:hypothetical protein
MIKFEYVKRQEAPSVLEQLAAMIRDCPKGHDVRVLEADLGMTYRQVAARVGSLKKAYGLSTRIAPCTDGTILFSPGSNGNGNGNGDSHARAVTQGRQQAGAAKGGVFVVKSLPMQYGDMLDRLVKKYGRVRIPKRLFRSISARASFVHGARGRHIVSGTNKGCRFVLVSQAPSGYKRERLRATPAHILAKRKA